MFKFSKLVITGVIFATSQLFCVNAALADNNQSQGINLSQVDLSQLSVLYSPSKNSVAGNPKGQITIVEFFDYNCGNCREMKPILDNVIKSNPNVRVVYKDLAFLGAASYPPAQAALAAQKQGKYIALRNAMMAANQPLTIDEIDTLANHLGINTIKLNKDMNDPEIVHQIQINNALANKIGMAGTPTFIIGPSSLASMPHHGTAQMALEGNHSFYDFRSAVTDISKSNQLS